ncbi:MAG: hemerythrin domain-containing protein [Planctomycetota bacterium]
MPRRHDTLIPLSHQHHHGLVMCQRVEKAVARGSREPAALEALRTEMVAFFDCDLAPHFAAEAEVLFPAIEHDLGPLALVRELLGEHGQLLALAAELRGCADPGPPLGEFAALLRAHIRKEEDLLFPRFESELDPARARELAAPLRARLGRP